MSVRPKKAAEAITALKITGSTAAEASSAVQSLRVIAEDSETATNAERCQASRIADELSRPTAIGEASRREALMQQAAALASKVS